MLWYNIWTWSSLMIEGTSKSCLSSIKFSWGCWDMDEVSVVFEDRLIIYPYQISVVSMRICLIIYKIWRCHVFIQQMGLDIDVLYFLVFILSICIYKGIAVRKYQFLHLWWYTWIVATCLLSCIFFGRHDLVFRYFQLFIISILLSGRWDIANDFSNARIAVYLGLYCLELGCSRWFISIIPSIMNLIRSIFHSGFSCHLPFRPRPILITTTSRIALSFSAVKKSIWWPAVHRRRQCV